MQGGAQGSGASTWAAPGVSCVTMLVWPPLCAPHTSLPRLVLSMVCLQPRLSCRKREGPSEQGVHAPGRLRRQLREQRGLDGSGGVRWRGCPRAGSERREQPPRGAWR